MRYLRGFPGQMVVLFAFLFTAFLVAMFLTSGSAVRVPVLESQVEYTSTVFLDDADNLVPASVVRVAGVQVGEVSTVTPTRRGARVKFTVVNDEVYPLHRGVNVRVGTKSLVGESYLGITDGQGPEIPSGTVLPRTAVEKSVRLYDVYETMDAPTREATDNLIASLDESTAGTKDDIAAAVEGLGALGREGYTALDAVAAQGDDLTGLARETTRLLRALDTSQGQVADLVTNANRLTSSTAGQRRAIEGTMRQLPGVLSSATTAGGELTDLSGALAPVAADLREAAPPVTTALRELPATTNDLRGLLPALSGTLDRAPATLDRVPRFASDVRNAVPEARGMLRDLNPVLGYAEPYGQELALFFSLFNAALGYDDKLDTNYVRIGLFMNDEFFQTPGVDTDLGTYENTYPGPDSNPDPGPFTGKYPRVERAPR